MTTPPGTATTAVVRASPWRNPRSWPPFLHARRRFRDPEQSCDREIILEHTSLLCWALKGPALEASFTLNSEIRPCLVHADLPNKPFWNFYMFGRSKATARPAVVIYGADHNSRKAAKRHLRKDNILRNERYDGWALRLMEREPGCPDYTPLIGSTLVHGLTTYNIDRADLRFERNSQKGSYIVTNLSSRTRNWGTLSGPLLIEEQLYLFTSAHVFTGHSPFDRAMPKNSTNRQGSRANPFDSDQDSSDAEDDEEGDVGKHSTQDIESLTGRLNPSRHSVRPVPATRGSDRTWSILRWPTETVEIIIGPDELDYALIKQPEKFAFDRFTGDSKYLEWFSPNGSECRPPAGRVVIFTAQRPNLHGTFLPTAMSTISSEIRSPLAYWIFFPDKDPLDPTESLVNGILPGDSGAWVCVDNKVCGHVIAGSSGTGTAIVLPSYITYDDIKMRLGIPNLSPRQDVPNLQGELIDRVQPPIGNRGRRALKFYAGTGSSSAAAARSIDDILSDTDQDNDDMDLDDSHHDAESLAKLRNISMVMLAISKFRSHAHLRARDHDELLSDEDLPHAHLDLRGASTVLLAIAKFKSHSHPKRSPVDAQSKSKKAATKTQKFPWKS